MNVKRQSFCTFPKSFKKYRCYLVFIVLILLHQTSLSEERLYPFDVPIQSLNTALLDFAEQANLQILFDQSIFDGNPKKSKPLIGQKTIKKALESLLSSSSLEYQFINPGLVVVKETGTHDALNQAPYMEEVISRGFRTPSQMDDFKDNTSIGSLSNISKLESSNSVSTTGISKFQQFADTNIANIFRNIPGFLSQSSSNDGSNVPITTRGLPIDVNGAKFLQLQEDGFPVAQFGDIEYAAAHSLIRYDNSIAKIEAIRGGSAATFASNAPGGIINIISKTGKKRSGSLSLTTGANYDHFRTNFEWGTPISDDWRMHIGGFLRASEGVKNAGYQGNSGGQLKANISKSFNNGYIRFFLKKLNDTNIVYFHVPVQENGESLPGFDATRDTTHSIYHTSTVGLGQNGNIIQTDIRNGASPDLDFIGSEISFNLNDSWTLNNRLGQTNLQGTWVSLFPSVLGAAQNIADLTLTLIPSADTSGPASLIYANGPNAGQAFDTANANGNGLLMHLNTLSAELNDHGSFSNDFTLSKKFTNGSLALGLYRGSQTIDTSWRFDSYLMEVKGENAALVDLVDASGNIASQNGLFAYGAPIFADDCCNVNYDIDYDIVAPYINTTFNTNNTNIDISVRYDDGKARGNYTIKSTASAVDINRDGIIQIPEQRVISPDISKPLPVNYNWHYLSYSAGTNTKLTDNTATFFRLSHGERGRADRILLNDVVLPDGSIAQNDTTDEIDQYELGYKLQTDHFGLYTTLFHVEAELQTVSPERPRQINRDLKTTGLELEYILQHGNFIMDGHITWVDAKINSDRLTPSNIGNTPARQPNILYSINPAYYTNRLSIGANILGSGKSFTSDTNNVKHEAFTHVNLFAHFDIQKDIRLSLKVNNVFDKEALSEVQEDSVNTISAPGTASDGLRVVRGRVYAGRSALLSLQYQF